MVEEFLVARLTDEQKTHLTSILWFLQDGPHRSGRTLVLATAFLIKAEYRTGEWIKIFDHTPMMNRNIINMVHTLFLNSFNTKKFKIEIKPQENSFRICCL